MIATRVRVKRWSRRSSRATCLYLVTWVDESGHAQRACVIGNAAAHEMAGWLRMAGRRR